MLLLWCLFYLWFVKYWNISRAAEQASPRQDLCVLWIWIASRANGVRQQAAAQLKSNTTVSSRSCGMSSSRFWIYRAYYKLFIRKNADISSSLLGDHHRRFSFHFDVTFFRAAQRKNRSCSREAKRAHPQSSEIRSNEIVITLYFIHRCKCLIRFSISYIHAWHERIWNSSFFCFIHFLTSYVRLNRTYAYFVYFRWKYFS